MDGGQDRSHARADWHPRFADLAVGNKVRRYDVVAGDALGQKEFPSQPRLVSARMGVALHTSCR
jgi:hypothetical protein